MVGATISSGRKVATGLDLPDKAGLTVAYSSPEVGSK